MKMTDKMTCRAPRAGEWVRVNPDPEYRRELPLLYRDGDYYLVADHMVPELDKVRPGAIQHHMVFLACNRDNEGFLWPVKLPVPEAHLAYRAMREWVCFPSLQ
jgi:hypothetical protein